VGNSGVRILSRMGGPCHELAHGGYGRNNASQEKISEQKVPALLEMSRFNKSSGKNDLD
jgi:hypothetical protein